MILIKIDICDAVVARRQTKFSRGGWQHWQGGSWFHVLKFLRLNFILMLLLMLTSDF